MRRAALAAAALLSMAAARAGPATVRPPPVLHVGEIALRPASGVLENLTDCRSRKTGVCAAPQWTGAAKPS